MDEISMFKVLRPAPPAGVDGMSQAVRSRLDQALAPGPPASLARGRKARLALAGGLSLALAAGAVAMAVTWSGGSGHARISRAGAGATQWAPASRAVREVAYRTAAVAAAQPDVRPGQWVYWKEKQLGGKPAGIFQVWTTADSRRAAYVDDKGKVNRIALCDGGTAKTRSPSCAQFIGQPAVFVAPAGVSVSGVNGTIPVSYAGLRVLPRTPRALVAFLGGLHLPGWGPAPVRAFEIIKDVLTTYVMPPGLTAELYRALALIPGVTIDRRAADVAGRPGIGLSMTTRSASGGVVDEIIIDPRTYQLAGQQLLTAPHAGAAGHVLSGTAILKRGLASGPGKLP